MVVGPIGHMESFSTKQAKLSEVSTCKQTVQHCFIIQSIQTCQVTTLTDGGNVCVMCIATLKRVFRFESQPPSNAIQLNGFVNMEYLFVVNVKCGIRMASSSGFLANAFWESNPGANKTDIRINDLHTAA